MGEQRGKQEWSSRDGDACTEEKERGSKDNLGAGTGEQG